MSKNDSYFQDKRGEINDLKNLLRDIHVERDPKKKREVVRKVIAFDTLGYDCSRLFSEMVIATSTNDIVVKKMAYQYLSHYARGNEELATLCVNTMTKDCGDADPMVRGLAIRSLSSLRLKSTLEYLVPLLLKSLDDPSGYVRRNGAVAVLKLFHLSPDFLTEESAAYPFIQKLEFMMNTDRDSTVVAAAIQTLEEIHQSSGGISCDSNLFKTLLARSQEFNEWGLCTVLNVISRYSPKESTDMFEAMNILDPCLRQTNSAVVLYCSKIFAKYAEQVPDIKTAVYLRLKEPLLTLMSSSSMEMKYTTLCHLELLIKESSIVFEDSFKSFFLQFDEPFCVKKIKLRILPLLSNLDNYQEILSELSEYVTDVNGSIARLAVHSLAKIALQIKSAGVDVVLLKLLEFLELLDEKVRGDVLDAFKDILQQFPDRAPLVVPALQRFVLKEVRSSAIWMLGEFGMIENSSPYLLERLVERSDELDSQIKCELLTALIKLFFKQRALEVRPALEKLLQLMLNDVTDLDAHDRALFYFRLLKSDLLNAGQIICYESSTFGFSQDEQIPPNEFFDEFNTLAVVYGKHASQFIDEAHFFPKGNEEEENKPIISNSKNNNNNRNDQTTMIDFSNDVSSSGSSFLTLDVNTFKYENGFELDQGNFQNLWMKECPDEKALLKVVKMMSNIDTIESKLLSRNIKCIASGGVGDVLKFYFYAAKGNTPLLSEVDISTKDGEITVSVKTPGTPALAKEFAQDIIEWI